MIHMETQSQRWNRENPERRKEIGRKYDSQNKETRTLKAHNRNLKKKYGITLDEYYAMLEEQQGRCKICNSTTAISEDNLIQRFAVDHCHQTGRVRGLLCIRCNAGLGMFLDNEVFLAAAISYLKENK